MIEICLYKIENGKLGSFILEYKSPVVPRVGELIFIKKVYEVVEVTHYINGPRNDGFNWVEVLVQ